MNGTKLSWISWNVACDESFMYRCEGVGDKFKALSLPNNKKENKKIKALETSSFIFSLGELVLTIATPDN